MKRADTILDLGPGAGKFGGEVVAQGSLAHPEEQEERDGQASNIR
jgi:excinuclease ABC subunit A